MLLGTTPGGRGLLGRVSRASGLSGRSGLVRTLVPRLVPLLAPDGQCLFIPSFVTFGNSETYSTDSASYSHSYHYGRDST